MESPWSFVKVKVLVAQLCPLLPARLCPWDSPGKNWSGLPFPSPGDLPDPGIEPTSPASQVYSLPSEPPGKPVVICILVFLGGWFISYFVLFGFICSQCTCKTFSDWVSGVAMTLTLWIICNYVPSHMAQEWQNSQLNGSLACSGSHLATSADVWESQFWQQDLIWRFYVFCFFFFTLLIVWCHHAACGILLVPWPGIKPGPLHWKTGVLPTKFQGSPQGTFSFKVSLERKIWETWSNGNDIFIFFFFYFFYF